MYMTSSIPDSISAEALEALAENAHADIELPQESVSMEQMQELVINDIEALTDKFDSMFGYKLVAHYALFKLFQAHNLMHTDECGAQDFMCPLDDD